MNKSRLGLNIILILATLLACRCGPRQGPSPTSTTAQIENAQPILTVTGLSGSQSLTLAQLKALPATEGWAGIKSSVGTITPPAQYKGVSLINLSNLVGGLAADTVVEIAAADGYAMTMSFNEAAMASSSLTIRLAATRFRTGTPCRL